MKKCLGALGVLAALLLSGCGGELGQVGAVLDDWRGGEDSPGARAAEYEQADSPDFTDSLGFAVTTLPDAETYVPEHYWVLDGWYAQVEFVTADDRKLNMRVAEVKGNKLLSSTYAEAHAKLGDSYEIDGIEVVTRGAPEGCAMASWRRDGYQYLLHAARQTGMPTEAEITAFVQSFIAG